MEQDERDKEILKFMLADFVAIKAEIARRSALQWAVLAGYLFFMNQAFATMVPLYTAWFHKRRESPASL